MRNAAPAVKQPLMIVSSVRYVDNGQQPSKLDYIFTLHDNEVEKMNYLSPIGLSDHVGLIWKLNCSLAMHSNIPSFKYAYWKGDYESMTTRLSEINWKTSLDGKCPGNVE